MANIVNELVNQVVDLAYPTSMLFHVIIVILFQLLVMDLILICLLYIGQAKVFNTG